VEWGKAQNARFYNMGGTKAWRCVRSYQFKAKWRPQVTRRKWATQRLTIAADRLSPLLKEKINASGFICEVDDRCYGLLLDKTGSNLSESALAEMVASAQKDGLHGVCVLAPESHPMRIPKAPKTLASLNVVPNSRQFGFQGHLAGSKIEVQHSAVRSGCRQLSAGGHFQHPPKKPFPDSGSLPSSRDRQPAESRSIERSSNA
jgi:hypothetical protein